jgi:hypothetical protein
VSADPKSLVGVANEFAAWFGLPPLPKVDLVPLPRSIDLTQYTEQELRWMAEAQEEQP